MTLPKLSSTSQIILAKLLENKKSKRTIYLLHYKNYFDANRISFSAGDVSTHLW